MVVSGPRSARVKLLLIAQIDTSRVTFWTVITVLYVTSRDRQCMIEEKRVSSQDLWWIYRE